MSKKKQDSIFKQEMKRDLATYQRLSGRKKVRFIWDYYKFKIIAAIVILIIVGGAAKMLYEGQRPQRLNVCVVLNDDDITCKSWFNDFFKELQKDGKEGVCNLNEDQPFDYKNKYYYLQEIEVMTTISSLRMDVAICGPDMYDYVLALNACAPLDRELPAETVEKLKENGMLVQSRANITQKEDGTMDESKAIEGYFAIDITNTSFGKEYNSDPKTPLYAIIISNTDHMADSVKLLEALIK